MEGLYKNIKDFILTTMNDILPSFEDETVKLPKITDKQIVFGVIDGLKNQQDVVVSVLPESQEEAEEQNIFAVTMNNNFTITFAFRGEKYDILIKRMCRYTSAFKKALFLEPKLNNTVYDTELGIIKFYGDCGTVEKTMTASEIDLNIYTISEE